MDKIKDMLKQLGASAELMESFTKELTGYKAKCEADAKAVYDKRIAEAKEVIIADVQEEKAELARKIEVYLEATISRINREASKQAAIGESETVKTLKGIKALLEGVTIDGNPEDNQAAVAENKKLRVMVAKLTEEKEQAAASAQNANRIAMKALARNKVLESRGTETPTQVTESTEKPAAGRSLENLRTAQTQPTTTRQTLTESQTTKPSSKPVTAHGDIAAIADKLDGTPAYVGR